MPSNNRSQDQERSALLADNALLEGEKQNINISAYRVLYILRVLVQHQSLNMLDLNQHLFDNPTIHRTYNSETITKYINTLRKVGCRIPRTSSRNDYHYVLIENPFSIELSADELRVARQMLRILGFQSDETLAVRYHQFLEKVAWILKEPQKHELLSHITMGKPSLPLQQRRRLLGDYKEFCRDALVLELDYQADALRQLSLVIEPARVVQEGSRMFLLGLDRVSRGQVKLNLEKIITVRQLPSKIDGTSKAVHVVFQLYGRLAKSYRLYPGEELVFTQGETIQVKVRTDDVATLLNRLLKYNVLCQVISPASARQQMRQRIQDLIDHCSRPTPATPAG